MHLDAFIGKRVVNGCGEVLGTVVEVVRDRKGRLALRVREPGPLGPIRLVETEHVLGVDGDAVRLKGPRQGYHIAPLVRPPESLHPEFALRDRW